MAACFSIWHAVERHPDGLAAAAAACMSYPLFWLAGPLAILSILMLLATPIVAIVLFCKKRPWLGLGTLVMATWWTIVMLVYFMAWFNVYD